MRVVAARQPPRHPAASAFEMAMQPVGLDQCCQVSLVWSQLANTAGCAKKWTTKRSFSPPWTTQVRQLFWKLHIPATPTKHIVTARCSPPDDQPRQARLSTAGALAVVRRWGQSTHLQRASSPSHKNGRTFCSCRDRCVSIASVQRSMSVLFGDSRSLGRRKSSTSCWESSNASWESQ